MLDNIKYLVAKYDLDSPQKTRDRSYRRYFLYDYLYPLLTLEKIGELFNRDHATVLKGIRMAQLFESAHDQVYLEMVKDVRDDLVGAVASGDVQRTAAGVVKHFHEILLKTQDDPFEDVAWEIAVSVVEMIAGTQQDRQQMFWMDVAKKIKGIGCNHFEKDTLS
jgi:hypothetical protein